MIRTICAAFCLMLVSVASSAPATAQDMPRKVQPFCTYPAPGKVIFRGDGSDLATCLDGAHERIISELRLSVRGGDTAMVLKLAGRYAGRLEHLIVEDRCSGPCASYIVPVAARLTVEPNALLLLQPAFDAEKLIAKMKQLKTELERSRPGRTITLSPSESEAWAIEKEQDDFDRRWLSCRQWLHPDTLPATPEWTKRQPQIPAEKITATIVSKTMATRCLKQTKLAAFWSPTSEKDIPAPLRTEGAVLVP